MAKLATLTARTAATVLDTDLLYLTDTAGLTTLRFRVRLSCFLQWKHELPPQMG